MKRFTGISFSLALFSIASGCATIPTRSGGAETTLVVALYPYVPRLLQFRTAIAAAWADVHPEVSLSFLPARDWDGGYSDNPPSDADVFVFDAMFFEYFRSKGWLEPMASFEIDHLDDFVAYALGGVVVDGKYWAIPQLGCANILFYQLDDTPLARATTLSEVEDALGKCTYTSQIPPGRRGLMIDMAGGTTNASLYLDAVHSVTGQYPPPLPWDESQIDTAAISNLRSLLAMASYENGTADESTPYERGTWFSEGWGRAVVGYTESMSAMSAETRDNIGFKVLPLSDTGSSAMFYADFIGVSATTHRRHTRDLAVRLANVIASSATMVASIGPDGDHPYPQYLMPTRPSIFQTLGKSFPIYKKMYGLVMAGNPVLFGIDARSRDWLAAMKNTIRADAREDYSCGCDYQASELIPDDAAAPAICHAACADHGGWSGAWTNKYPAAPAGTSACGCNACPSR